MMTMIKFSKPILVVLLVTGIAYTGFAQRTNLRQQSFNRVAPVTAPAPANDNLPNAEQTRRIQIIKENYFVRELGLSTDQSNKFLKVYRSWQNTMADIRRLKRLNNSSSQSNGPAQLEKDLAYDRQLIDAKEHFQNEFLKVLSAEKLSQLYKLEQKFKDEIYKNLTERQ
jgi:membrane-associated HD superfamily phosphohydrolase